MGGDAAMMERYEKLGLAEALGRAYDYPSACQELSLILRLAYAQMPKNMQSLVFRDALAAFRLLPEVQTGHGVSAANSLLQAAEVALPKQKKTLSVSEFRHAVVAQKRRSKAHQDGGSVQLPHDVLVHVFSFLDTRSLVTVSLVCWAWNSAGSDDRLWQSQYSLLFGECDINSKQTHSFLPNRDMVLDQSTEGADPLSNLNWKEVFRRKYMAHPSWKFGTYRALCVHCESIIWLSNVTCARSHQCPRLENQKVKLRPLSPHRVVEYLLRETELTMSSSESEDSDSDGFAHYMPRLPKLWAYPRLADKSSQPFEI